MVTDIDYTIHYTEHQWNVNDFWSFKEGKYKVILSLYSITVVLAAFIGKTASDSHCPILKMDVNQASMIFGFASWVI